MTYNFLRPQDPYPLDDFESNLTELAMKVDRDFGGFEIAAQTALALYQKAAPHLESEDAASFMKLISHFKNLAYLADKSREEYLDVQAELNSYITGNFVFDEQRRELIYLDHQNFKNKYPQWNTTEIK